MTNFAVVSILPISRIVLAKNLTTLQVESLKFSADANLEALAEHSIITINEISAPAVIRFADAFSLVVDNG